MEAHNWMKIPILKPCQVLFLMLGPPQTVPGQWQRFWNESTHKERVLCPHGLLQVPVKYVFQTNLRLTFRPSVCILEVFSMSPTIEWSLGEQIKLAKVRKRVQTSSSQPFCLSILTVAQMEGTAGISGGWRRWGVHWQDLFWGIDLTSSEVKGPGWWVWLYLSGRNRVLYRMAPSVHCTSRSYTSCAVCRFG